MRFHVQGQSYQFKTLPFGLFTAPIEFMVVVKEVKLWHCILQFVQHHVDAFLYNALYPI